MEFQNLLAHAFSGDGILFCGAGFSADCLSLSESAELGTGAALLAVLNKELRYEIPTPYRDLRNAADKFMNVRGESTLIALLRDRFRVARVTDDMVEIVRFPWKRIYTTNYDCALQIACTRAEKNFKTLNNLDTPDTVPGAGTEIVHLHGCAEKWDIYNFGRSCVLGADSYFETEKILGPWVNKLQDDFDRARVFVFVGFSAGDFHLNQVFYNSREARPKVFFVNRPAAAADPDTQATQEKFGWPLSIGRQGLANLVRGVIEGDKPAEPSAPSYRRYERSQAEEVPSVEAIRDLFVFGKVDKAQIVRDLALNKADYHIPRQVTSDIIDGIDSGKSVTVITGEICDGKSVLLEELSARLALSRPVYILHRSYETVVEETSSLIAAHSNPVFLIENCFDLSPSRLENLLSLFQTSKASLVLTSRSISARAEISESERLNEFPSLQRIRLSRLTDDEIEQLIRLSDQIAGWVEFPAGHTERVRFIRDRCRGSLPAFLLELLKSEFVKDRYSEEYRKTAELCSPREISAIVAALYIAHIGHDAPLSFLSNIFKADLSAALRRFESGRNGLHLIRVEGRHLKTIPSIGAARILREIIAHQDRRLIVNVVVDILKSISENRQGHDFENQVFTQLMRYSILSTVVDDEREINRFFDNVSKIDYCRTKVLFWLQWHMAMVDQKRWVDAETYLKRGYTEADAVEKRTGRRFDSVQLDDRKAKFIMIRDRAEPFRMNMVHDLRESCQITERLLRRNDLTHHPFDTFYDILEFFNDARFQFPEDIQSSSREMIVRLGDLARERARLLDSGYPVSRANRALEKLEIVVSSER